MINPRIYGILPPEVVLVHGGPGAAGYLGPVAGRLGAHCRVVEPFQTADTLEGQVAELAGQIRDHTDPPVILAGHSWGAWLSAVVAARHPELVSKLILIAAGPFEDAYAADITAERLRRLPEADRRHLMALQKEWHFLSGTERVDVFRQIGRLINRADAYAPVSPEDHTQSYQPEIFERVWSGADALRKSGELLELMASVRCPSVAIHGDHDPHPWEGVKEPLERRLQGFRFHLLSKCGHEPWNEKHARVEFYRIMEEEVGQM